MLPRQADPRTEDTLLFDLLRTPAGAGEGEVVGRATFRGGRSTVEAPDEIRIAVEELLARAFVDRVQADERPRGYRRTGRGNVDMLVPGMAEHFIARLRGLWLSYPDGSVVTAREAGFVGSMALAVPEAIEAGPSVVDATTRRSSLASAERTVNARPLVISHPPETGIRPETGLSHDPLAPVSRTDCGWLV
jgi:hypothetical protein